MRDDERPFAALAHLLAAIPLWGVIGDTVIWLYFKERCREVVFHAQQAILFQVTVLVLIVVAEVAALLGRIVRFINENLSEFILDANYKILIVCFVAYVAICLYGAWVTWTGGSFLYPFIGRRMAQGFRRNQEDA